MTVWISCSTNLIFDGSKFTDIRYDNTWDNIEEALVFLNNHKNTSGFIDIKNYNKQVHISIFFREANVYPEDYPILEKYRKTIPIDEAINLLHYLNNYKDK